MILSSRPTDRRQLIEEAAGITKYKARRRAAELKLEAAQQNLTRIDDIVFEVEKQRGTLKRQAAKARRYQKLRDELRRWEKVLFARKYRQLAETIESARGAAGRRARARVGRGGARRRSRDRISAALRIELVEAESRATAAREAAHARELAINRQQQQIAFDREQIAGARRRATAIVGAELDDARGAARAGARWRSTARRDGGGRGRRRARPRGGDARRRVARRTTRRIARSKGSRRTSKRRAARCSRRSTRRPRCATRSSTRRPRAIASARRSSKLDVEIERRPASSRSASAADRAAAADGLRRAHEAIEATRIARVGARVRAGQRAHRARMARARRSARASRSSPASRRA